MAERTAKEQMVARWGALDAEFSSWRPHYQDLSENILPRNGRYFAEDRNKGQNRTNRIMDNTATRASRTLAAGMLGGLTSPARPWFRLTTPDTELAQYQPVKEWLAQVTRKMQTVFAQSNTYRALHGVYEELGVFGTSATTVLDDYEHLMHAYPHTAGEYRLATDHRNVVDTMYRQVQKTVRQLVMEFGRANCSATVQNMYDRGDYDQWVTILHAIEPRKDRDPAKADSGNMAWRSTYMEHGDNDPNKLLRDSGFKRFRVLAPRWITTGQDVYGMSPGMEVLGDVKQLQHEQLRKSQGIDYQTRPPLQAPTSMKHMEVDMLPGGVTFVDSTSQGGGVRPSFEAQINLNYLLEDIRDVRERIKSGMFEDLFLMLASGNLPASMTATEVAERHEEKLLMLGPVLERLHNELLDPLVEITFDRMLDAGVVPPPPEELAGSDLDVEFVSLLAQAQRAIGNNSTDRFVGNLGVIAGLKPEVLDKFDADQWVDIYSDNLGVDPSIIIGDDKVKLVRQERAKMQAAQAAQEQAAQAADTAAKLGTVDTAGKNGATDIINQLSGYGSPAPYAY